MKRLSIILLLALAACATGRAEIPVGWSTNYAATLSEAKSAGQPVLLYFTADWCGPCKLMSRITLTDPTVAAMLSNVLCTAVDIDEQPDLASKHHVTAVPTFILLATADHEINRTTGFRAAIDFLPWLTNGIAGAKAAAIQFALAQKTMAEVKELLAKTETNATRLAAVKLFALCNERDPAIVQAAAAQLDVVAHRDPGALVEGLKDPHLATRILVANMLRGLLGDEFNVDPWSDAATREQEVLSLHKKLLKSR